MDATIYPEPVVSVPQDKHRKATRYVVGGLAVAFVFCLGGYIGNVTAAPKTPEVCSQALGAAETVIGDGTKALTIISDAMGSFSIYSMNSASSQLKDLAPVAKNDRANYDSLASKCRDAK
jgi:hypothetical protein